MKALGKSETLKFMKEKETERKRFFKREVFTKRDPFIFYPVLLSTTCILAQIFLIAFYILSLPSKIPLFYSRAWGESQLSHPSFLWMLPAGSLVILSLNSLLSYLARGRLLPIRILMGFALFSILAIFVTLFRIIVLVS